MTSFKNNGPNLKTELEENNPKEDKGEKEKKNPGKGKIKSIKILMKWELSSKYMCAE